MQKLFLDSAKSTVIRSLQARLTVQTSRGPAERAPGSQYSIGIERAIDYALSPRRDQPEVAFLKHDVLRNARLAVRRSAKSEDRTVAEVASIGAPPHQAFDGRLRASPRGLDGRTGRPGVHTAGAGGRVAGTAIVELTTPEDIAVARDIEDRLRATVADELGSFTSNVLEGLLCGETVSESAKRLDTSPRTVDRARSSVRVRAKELLSPEATAEVRRALPVASRASNWPRSDGDV